MRASIEQGNTRLSKDLVLEIALGQKRHLQSLRQNYDSAQESGTYLKPADSTDRASLMKLKLKASTSQFRMSRGTAVVQQTGEVIYFRPLTPRVSRLYARTHHYLHHYREDEYASFGAFQAGQKYPFAWVSYSKVGRRYRHLLLQKAGYNSQSSLELTRAWCNADSPKNTMSMLYAYAHGAMQDFWRRHGSQLESVISSINPNLGFRGTSFRAVGFETVGLKPTMYSYLVNQDNSHVYLTRRAIDALQKNHTAKTRPANVRIVTSQFPLLPTNEMVVRLANGKKNYNCE